MLIPFPLRKSFGTGIQIYATLDPVLWGSCPADGQRKLPSLPLSGASLAFGVEPSPAKSQGITRTLYIHV